MTSKLALFFLTTLGAAHFSYAQLSGSYSINNNLPTAGTNFASFSSAATALNSQGVSGAVNITVSPNSGPYNEQVTFASITGASAVNTITINGNGNALVSASTGTLAAITLNGTDYLTIDSLVITTTDPNFGWGVLLTAGADNNIIRRCSISMPKSFTTPNDNLGIAISNSTTAYASQGSNGSNNKIQNNTITGGVWGISVYGGAAPFVNSGNQVTGNKIIDAEMGIYLALNSFATVKGNEIYHATRTSFNTTANLVPAGMVLNSISDCMVENNKIHSLLAGNATSTVAAHGIFFTGTSGQITSNTKIQNNLIYGFKGNGVQYGIRGYDSQNPGGYYIYHNTVSLDNAASTAGATYGYYKASAKSDTLRNNVFNITRGGSGAKYGIYITGTNTTVANNNNYFVGGAGTGTLNIGYNTNAASSTLALWQSASGQDANSHSTDPQFSNPASANYIPTASTLDNLGAPVNVLNDINGLFRSITTPDIGAYEFGSATGVNLTGPANVCVNSTATLTGSPSGGTYSSSNTAVATINPTTGVLTPVAAGSVVITYTSGSSSATLTVAVNSMPAISANTGTTNVCTASTTQLSNATSGGTWSSSNTSVATVNASGLVFGLTAGSVNIVYTLTNGACSATATSAVTVNAMPTVSPIVGAIAVCTGSTGQLTNATPGGVWSSNNNAVATVDANGLVTGVSAGNADIAYVVTINGCSTTSSVNITVNASPAITANTGNNTICLGAATQLANNTSGGTWNSSNSSVATVDAAGMVTGLSAGNSNITYTVSNGTCTAVSTTQLTVNPFPDPLVTASGNTLSTGAYQTYQWIDAGNTPIANANAQTYQTNVAGNYRVFVTDANGCGDTSDVFNFTPSSLKESPVFDGMKLYPNPMTDYLIVELPKTNGKIIATVEGIDGRVILESAFYASDRFRVDIRSLANGLYLLKLQTSDGTVRRKIIKQ